MISFKGAQFPKDVILFAVFFYVRIIVLMFFSKPGDDVTSTAVVVAPGILTRFAITICALGTLFLGLWPTPVLDLLAQATKFVG